MCCARRAFRQNAEPVTEGTNIGALHGTSTKHVRLCLSRSPPRVAVEAWVLSMPYAIPPRPEREDEYHEQ